MDKSKPILVLGSNSFSGSSFIDELLTGGYKVIGVSRSKEIAKVFCAYHKNTYLHNFKFEQIDLNGGAEIIAELVRLNKIEFVFNFIAQSMVAQSWNSSEHWYQTNVVSTSILANLLLKEKSIKKFIQFSTPEVYGSMSGWVKETFEFAPSTPYAISRAAGDWHLKGLFTNYGFPVIFTRASNVYGAGQQLYRIIPKAIFSALVGQKLILHGGGKSVRSFIHINDVSSALTSILERGVVGASYHISTRELISIIDLVQILALGLDKNIEEIIEIGPDRIGNDLAYQLDSDKIRNETGWNDEIDLNSGLQLTVDWIKSNLNSLKTFPSTYEHKR